MHHILVIKIASSNLDLSIMRPKLSETLRTRAIYANEKNCLITTQCRYPTNSSQNAIQPIHNNTTSLHL